jgi:hypothetical protein
MPPGKRFVSVALPAEDVLANAGSGPEESKRLFGLFETTGSERALRGPVEPAHAPSRAFGRSLQGRRCQPSTGFAEHACDNAG